MMPPRMRSCLTWMTSCFSVTLGFVTNFFVLGWIAKQLAPGNVLLFTMATAALLIGTVVCGVLGWRWAKAFFERFK